MGDFRCELWTPEKVVVGVFEYPRPEFIIGVYFKSNATGLWKVNFNCMKIIGAERNNEWRWVERWKHFSRKFYLWQKDGRSTVFIFIFCASTDLQQQQQLKQIYKEIETKHLGQNHLVLSGLTVFWDSRSHYQRYATVHRQNNRQTWTRM